MGIDEGEDMKAKGIHNIFNKIITENFPNLEKDMPIQVQKASSAHTDLTKIELTHAILSLICTSTEIKKEY
jgi:hypothetical protein